MGLNRESAHLNGRGALIAVGAGLNLSTYGLGVWGENVLLSSGAFVGPALATLAETYLLFAALGLFAALILRIAIAACTGQSNRFYLVCGLGPMIVAAVLFGSGLWNASGLLVALAAFCTGWSFACQSLFWMSALSFEPGQMRTVFPLELLVAAVVNVVFVAGFLNLQAIFLGAGIALSAAASVLLLHGDAQRERPAVAAPSRALQSRYLPGFRQLAEVLFCVVALQTIAPTLNYMGLSGALPPEQQQLAIIAAKMAAAVALVAILHWSRAPLYSVQVFKVVTPVLILLLFAVPFASAGYLFALLVGGSCLHFIVTNSLFCIDAVAIARRRGLVFELFYGTGYFALMAFCSVLEKVMPTLLAASSSMELLLVFGVFFCVYALSMAFVAVRRRRRDSGGDGAENTTAPASPPSSEPTVTTDAERVAAVQAHCGLSDREAEIVLLMMHGRNVPAIAEALVISQNTVRTHVKRIYRACGVHSRQELIARCETEESQGHSDGPPAKSPSNPS